jgi:hypothetical protein
VTFFSRKIAMIDIRIRDSESTEKGHLVQT